MDLVNVLFTVIGFLLGLGGMSIWVMKRVDSLAVKMATVDANIETLKEHEDETKEQVNMAIKLHTETTKMLTQLINQNNLLIQKIIVHSGS